MSTLYKFKKSKEFAFSVTTDVRILPLNHKVFKKHCPTSKSEHKLTFASSGMLLMSPSWTAFIIFFTIIVS